MKMCKHSLCFIFDKNKSFYEIGGEILRGAFFIEVGFMELCRFNRIIYDTLKFY